MVPFYRANDRFFQKILPWLLTAGMVFFGLVLPDSLSTHVKMVHFAAHFGMSFLLASVFYVFSTVKLQLPKRTSYSILIIATLIIGVIYKVWEVISLSVTQDGAWSSNTINGCITSMSQNISGLLAAMLLIETMSKHLVFVKPRIPVPSVPTNFLNVVKPAERLPLN